MKVRKLAVALALAGGLGSGVAQALGLGEIELQSYLNEPLDAEIALPQSRGVDPGDVFVNVAPEAAYERVGLDRNQFLSKLRFQVVTQSDGSLAVNVSSREPLREPYLNFLLELTWPSGRLMREYAVLVDPPVYAAESGARERVSAPATTAEPEAQAARSRSAESVRRQAQAEGSLGRGYQGQTFGPTGPSDTLWTIASRVRPNDSVSTQQVMLAIQDLNPDAFMAGNINRLKRGEVLRVPTLDQVQSRTRDEATRVVSRQNREFQSPQRTVDATTALPQQQAAPAQASEPGDELKLVVADKETRETADGGSAGGDGELPGGVDAGTAVAMEELESARRENEELNSRVEDLQDQVDTLQRLLELKNSQLADMQQMTAESAEQPVAADSDFAQGEAATAGQPAEAGDVESSAQTADDLAQQPTEEGQPAEAATDQEAAPAEASEAGEAATSEPEVAADTETVAAVEPGAEGEPGASGEAPQETAPEPAPVPEAQKGFAGNVIEAIANNPLYQVALGGGLILLLLLLLLLARRNANREKEFYEQLNSETDDSGDSFDLSLDDDESEQEPAGDALAEAEAYIAYGRHDQAAQALEAAISREPSRTDLRLKLLGVYADTQDRNSFEKQFGEIEALDDDDALARANELRDRLEEAESMPSIDDLESQLRSDSFGGSLEEAEATASSVQSGGSVELSDELLADQYDSEKEEQVENEFGDFDSDLADFDLTEIENSEAQASAGNEYSVEGETGQDEVTGEALTEEGEDDLIEYDLSGLSLDAEEDEQAGTAPEAPELEEAGLDESDEASAFEMELEEPVVDREADIEELPGEFEPQAEPERETVPEEKPGQPDELSDDDLDSLDESFLDELDAELDKVAGEDDELGGSEMEESSLDDLELDVSDEDLALMEEFSDTADSANHGQEETPDLDEELNLEDTLGEGDVLGETEPAAPEEEVADAEEIEEVFGSLDDELAKPESPEAPVEGEGPEEAGIEPPVDLDESDLGDDDDFDFLAGTDEAATKLDLARAYLEMGDSDGARDILEEVSLEGNEEQKAEAQDLLKNLS